MLLLIGLLFCHAAAGGEISRMIAGGRLAYTVIPGDYLIKIGARFGVSARIIARDNGIDYDATLYPGVKLRIDNLHIVPLALDDGILINLPQRMLFFFRDRKLLGAYPVGLGRSTWRTPEGDFSVRNLQQNKTWIVPKSIQEEMAAEGKTVLTRVAPGPDNPLGRDWIGLSVNGYGIHGTIAPASIYHFQSHGCIRLHPDDIAALFPQVKRGMEARIIYNPVLAAQADGRVYLEVNRDIYGRGYDLAAQARRLLDSERLSDRVDPELVAAVVGAQEGIAVDVTKSQSVAHRQCQASQC